MEAAQKIDVAEERFDLTIDGVRLAACWLVPQGVEESERPLVFLHEGLGCMAMWAEFPARLVAATGRRALLYDRYGHGLSDPLTGTRPDDFMHDEALRVLPDVLAQCGIDEPVLFSHSDGGTIALIHAATHPVRAVVTEAAHIYMDHMTLNGLRKVEAQWAKGSLQKFLEPFHGGRAEPMVREWLAFWHRQWERGWNIASVLNGIRCPLLAIQGSEDEYGTTAQLDDIVAGVSGPAERMLLDGCGHIPHLQEADRILEAAVAFIGENG